MRPVAPRCSIALDRQAKPPAITPGDKKGKTTSEEAQWRDAIERAKSSKR